VVPDRWLLEESLMLPPSNDSSARGELFRDEIMRERSAQTDKWSKTESGKRARARDMYHVHRGRNLERARDPPAYRAMHVLLTFPPRNTSPV